MDKKNVESDKVLLEVAEEPFVLIDKAINDIKDDYIGVDYYIKSLKEAIKQDATVISINSEYGGGKSSVCNLLANEKEYGLVSKISLWDVTLENKTSDALIKVEKKESYKFDVLSFYKSFLFQLSADYYSESYSRYVSKSLNKNTGIVNLFFKTPKIRAYFIVGCLFLLISGLFLGVEKFNPEIIEKIMNFFSISLNDDFFRYLFLLLSVGTFIYTIHKGRIVYSSWRSENNRVLTIDDVTSLYAEIINDSVDYKKKNLIIIEDIDRCLNTTNQQVIIDFITSVVKLLHFDCKDDELKQKLKSVVLIICLDEKKFIDRNNSELLLKLFDYRLDLDKIHQEDFAGLLDKLTENKKLSNRQKDQLMLFLQSENINIRLLKKEINDAFLKYNTLRSRFSEEDICIEFGPCVAAAYLKNNYPLSFKLFIDNTVLSSDKIRKAIEKNNRNEKIDDISIIDESYKNKESAFDQNIHLGFNKKVIEFIESGLIDEDFKLYFYNYPLTEKVKNIYETNFWRFLKGINDLDIENNNKLKKEKILEYASKVNKIKMKYPCDILRDTRTLSFLLEKDEDGQLLLLLQEKLLLNDEDSIYFTTELLTRLMEYGVPFEYIKKYLIILLNNNWKSINILKQNSFYNFRKILTKYSKDEIILFKNMFLGDFESIYNEEYSHITNKINAVKLINQIKFNNDLEDIILDLSPLIDINTKLEFRKFWASHIFIKEKYIEFTLSILANYDKYDNYLIKSLEPYFDMLENNDIFSSYINKIICNSSRETLSVINNHHIYFSLSEESVNKFVSFDICQTPLIYWLYNNEFDNIINCKRELQSRFNILFDDKFNYLNNNVCEFKKYILYSSKAINFDYLFTDSRFVEKFIIEIEYLRIINLHYLVILNVKDNDFILDYIKKVNLNNSQIIELLVKIDTYIPQETYIKSNLLIEILEAYPDKCQEIAKENMNFEKMISNIYTDYKYKLIIKYQIICNKLLPKYFIGLNTFKDEEYKLLYADFVNNLDFSLITIELLNSVNIYYPYKDEIITLYFNNGYFKEVVASFLLRKSLYKAKLSIDRLNRHDTLNLISHSDEFRNTLLRHVPFVQRVVALGIVNEIEDGFITQIIEKTQYNYKALLETYLLNISDAKLIRIFFSLKKIEEYDNSTFIKFISETSRILDIIKSNEELIQHLYNVIEPNYKGSLTNKLRNSGVKV